MLRKTLRPNDEPDPSGDIVTVATFQTIIEADLVREELQSAGIEASVGSGIIAQTFLTMPETGVTVEVRASDEARAREVIAGIDFSPISDDEINAASDASAADSGV